MKKLKTKQIRALLDLGYDNEAIMRIDEEIQIYGKPFPSDATTSRDRWVNRVNTGFENVRIEVIYGVFDRDEVIYVGRSKNLHTRILQHRDRFKPEQFRILQYCPFGDSDLKEKKWIRALNPRENRHV